MVVSNAALLLLIASGNLYNKHKQRVELLTVANILADVHIHAHRLLSMYEMVCKTK